MKGLFRLLALIVILCTFVVAPVSAQAPEPRSTVGPRPPAGGLADGLEIHKLSANSALLTDVPPYIWHYGCGPTTAAMLLGYWDHEWDELGYDWIIPGDASIQTDAINEIIASSTGEANHVTDYVYPKDVYPTLGLDNSEIGKQHHISNSLADYMSTSFSSRGNFFGWSWFSDVPVAISTYLGKANPGNFVFTVQNVKFSNGTLTWELFKSQIDSGHPMALLVDSNKDGDTDHFIPAFGYDDTGDVKYYAAYNTWDSKVHWYVWEPMNTITAFGVFGGTILDISRIPDTPTETSIPSSTPTPQFTPTETPTWNPTYTPSVTPTLQSTSTVISIPTPTWTVPQVDDPDIVIITKGSLDSIVDFLNWILYSGGALLLVSFGLERIKAFHRLSPRGRKIINLLLSLLLSLGVYTLLKVVPASVWQELDPFFRIGTGFFGIYTFQQLFHKIAKKDKDTTSDGEKA